MKIEQKIHTHLIIYCEHFSFFNRGRNTSPYNFGLIIRCKISLFDILISSYGFFRNIISYSINANLETRKKKKKMINQTNQ